MFAIARPARGNETVKLYCLRGVRTWTPDISKARKFETEREALNYSLKSGIAMCDGFHVVPV